MTTRTSHTSMTRLSRRDLLKSGGALIISFAFQSTSRSDANRPRSEEGARPAAVVRASGGWPAPSSKGVHGFRRDLRVDQELVRVAALDEAAGEKDLLEAFVRRHETASTLITTNRPTQDWGVFLGDVPAATAILDRFLAHATIVHTVGTQS